jgi:hypothetical protein
MRRVFFFNRRAGNQSISLSGNKWNPFRWHASLDRRTIDPNETGRDERRPMMIRNEDNENQTKE